MSDKDVARIINRLEAILGLLIWIWFWVACIWCAVMYHK
jgi:hypothetical protein